MNASSRVRVQGRWAQALGLKLILRTTCWHTSCRFPNIHMKETQPSAFTGTSSLARCHWVSWGQNWRKEESILFFSTGLKLLMDALPKSLHPHTTWKKWRDCKLMCLLVAMHYLLNRPKDYKQPLITCVLEKKYLIYSILRFSNNATRHYCQVMSETNPSLVSVALSIKT